MIAEDVQKLFQSHSTLLNSHKIFIEEITKFSSTTTETIKKLNEDVSKLTSEVQALKTQISIKSKVVGSVPDTMTPFASRLRPVSPPTANGIDMRTMK